MKELIYIINLCLIAIFPFDKNRNDRIIKTVRNLIVISIPYDVAGLVYHKALFVRKKCQINNY